MMRRRRPLARAAVVGGAAYYAGKRTQDRQYREADQEARLQDLEAQQAYSQEQQYAPPPPAAAPPPPAPAAGGLGPDAMAQLQQLAQLKDQGILTEEEFAAQKAKILNG